MGSNKSKLVVKVSATSIILFVTVAAIVLPPTFLDLELYDAVFIDLIVVAFSAGALLVVLVPDSMESRISKYKGAEENEPLVLECMNRKRSWFASCFCFQLGHYWVVISALVSSCIVIYLGAFGDGENDKNKLVIYSIVALVLSVSTFVVSPLDIAKGYRKAFEIADNALWEYYVYTLYDEDTAGAENCATNRVTTANTRDLNDDIRTDLSRRLKILKAMEDGEQAISKKLYYDK